MAYFRCSTGGASGSGIPLVVTCASAFAGLTITCSDGTTTLTDTCPSSSPYEITFNLPNTGTWTVSGTISGQTFTTTVLVNEFDVELKSNVDITVDVYSAASDTVSYTGLDGQTHTISTDTDGHATATITIDPNGSTLTFTSSVAKDPSNLSNDYTKSITLTSATTAIYVCPDGALYWYGYKKQSFTAKANRNGDQSGVVGHTPTITYNTNSMTISQPTAPSSGSYRGVWISDNIYDFSQYQSLNAIAHDWQKGNDTGTWGTNMTSSITDSDPFTQINSLQLINTSSTPQLFSTTNDTSTGNNQYPIINSQRSHNNLASCTIDAFWLE